MGSTRISVPERFWPKVDKSGDCWLWTGAVNQWGYGIASSEGRKVMAHRAAWELTHGPIPDGARVRHRCDSRACVRPDHLFLREGERLTDDEVRSIRRRYAAGEKQQDIADSLGIKQWTVSTIVRRQRWAHVD